MVLKLGAKCNEQIGTAKDSVLHIAVRGSKTEVVDVLLANNADPNLKNGEGMLFLTSCDSNRSNATVHCVKTWQQPNL